MSLAQPALEDRPQGLTLNLSSNNPFRNRAVSPGPLQSTSPNGLITPPRPVSRNPFLDATTASPGEDIFDASPPKMAPTTIPASSPARPNPSGNAADLFENLTLDGKPASNGMRLPPSRTMTDKAPPGKGRPENMPSRGPPMHRPTRSQEDAMRARRGGPSRTRPGNGELNIFADPAESPRKSGERSLRRNSESSVADRSSRLLDSEEEKKRRERRHRERKSGKDANSKDPKRPNRKLDVIDQLDATSIYGTGLFHHDGPFDACNPHRNRKNSRRAPMQAFPKDSLNNVLGGSGPLNKRPDHTTFMGQADEEAFKDYATGGAPRTEYEPYGNGAIRQSSRNDAMVQSSLQKVEPIHGEESLGLGTSTFLEGAPASRMAIERRESEAALPEGPGLSRKKSLAQKIRGMSNNRRGDSGPQGRVTSPDGMYSPTSLGGTPGGSHSKASEPNPFFNEFQPNDKKAETITVVEPANRPSRARAPSSPRPLGGRLERRQTSDGSGSGPSDEQPKQNMGFLSRVKSLKGGPRRPKAEKAAE